MKIIDSLGNPRVLGVLLAVSVAINVFIGGAAVGHLGARGREPPPMFAPGGETMFRFMPERERHAMREQLRRARPELRDEHRRMRALHREIAEELGKPEPDRTLVEQKLGEVRAQMATIEEAMHAAFLETVFALPPAERQRLLRDLRRHHGPAGPRPPHRPGHGPQPPEMPEELPDGPEPGEPPYVDEPPPPAD